MPFPYTSARRITTRFVSNALFSGAFARVPAGTGSIVFCEFTGSRGYGYGMNVSATITTILRYLRCSSFFDSMMPSKRASTPKPSTSTKSPMNLSSRFHSWSKAAKSATRRFAASPHSSGSIQNSSSSSKS
jgi:hypothetical protein